MPPKLELAQIRRELAALDTPRTRKMNSLKGDEHGVHLGRLRDLAKRLKVRHDLALALWQTGDVAARLLACLVCRPKGFEEFDLDRMVKEIDSPKLLDWFVANVVKRSSRSEVLFERWRHGENLVGRAGWALAADRAAKDPDWSELGRLLDQIEEGMKQAPACKQWAMNQCLAEIGINQPRLRARAIDIGQRLAVFIDYPTPPGCTSPYAPTWICEIVRRRSEEPLTETQ